jgi:sugar phosphate isomerase/epimerase
MKLNRRDFIYSAGALAAGGLILPGCASTQNGMNSQSSASGAKLNAYGIQLYTLRDDMPKDPKGVLKAISSFGYGQIEGYEGKQGLWWDMPHKEFKKYINDLGLTMVSSHCNINENFEQKAAEAAEVGLSYLICPWIGPQKSVAAWKEVTDKFNACGEICRKNGIRFAYHNHAYSFVPFSGMIPQEYMMENTNPETVDHEMDIYWVVTGGADPITYLDKYPNRFRLCHVKDRMKNVATTEEFASCDLGTGSIDYPSILKRAAERGMQYFILEQERYDNSTPLKSAQAGAKYLKELRFV